MEIVSEEKLEKWVEHVRIYANNGKVADYIPALKRQNPEINAAAFYSTNGECVGAGQTQYTFTLQSVSKVLALAVALMKHGESAVFSRVGKEPTSEPFYTISKIELERPSKPINPMINAGALAVTNMLYGENSEEMFKQILHFVHKLTGDSTIDYDPEVAKSEYETAFLNRSLCYFMKQNGIITGSVEELLDTYTKQCAIRMNVKQLAKIGAIFANDGVDIESGEQLIPRHHARICKTFMVTCGMYNESGSFAINVGIPAKSGVSGVILGVVRDIGGVAVFGPALDEKGNSVVGLKLLEMMSDYYGWSIF
ncbi:glutaminase A [Salinibacillus xinjiangensis]|uniref:Glutaminase n=1 Tax=Salinibacillus xinjiangensis TaxID=1229268 RepID=A0A6G1X3Y0_9BACI|nr:glutaminase A [Salinibacillus xinjiangensis]MRG85538.1 glutaminase A [Salinibacillus xinjiangensis]